MLLVIFGMRNKRGKVSDKRGPILEPILKSSSSICFRFSNPPEMEKLRISAFPNAFFRVKEI